MHGLRYYGRKGWEETKNILRQVVFLPQCRLCGVRLVHGDESCLCRGCRAAIRQSDGHACRICGKFLSGAAAVCGECAVARPPFLFHASAARYEEPLKNVIHLYKYAGLEPLKHLFASWYLELHARKLPQVSVDMVVPVPADRTRHREFQPVAAAAKILARKLGLPFVPESLIKVRSTRPQAGLTRADRLRNLRGAFTTPDPDFLRGKFVLLLDDVYTTGTTIRTCAQELAAAGAQVIALTLAQSAWGEFN